MKYPSNPPARTTLEHHISGRHSRYIHNHVVVSDKEEKKIDETMLMFVMFFA